MKLVIDRKKYEDACKKKGYSLSKAARKADIAYPTMIRCLNNETDASLSTISKLCNVVDISMVDIVTEDYDTEEIERRGRKRKEA